MLDTAVEPDSRHWMTLITPESMHGILMLDLPGPPNRESTPRTPSRPGAVWWRNAVPPGLGSVREDRALTHSTPRRHPVVGLRPPPPEPDAEAITTTRSARWIPHDRAKGGRYSSGYRPPAVRAFGPPSFGAATPPYGRAGGRRARSRPPTPSGCRRAHHGPVTRLGLCSCLDHGRSAAGSRPGRIRRTRSKCETVHSVRPLETPAARVESTGRCHEVDESRAVFTVESSCDGRDL
jgi:hypothetical protein